MRKRNLFLVLLLSFLLLVSCNSNDDDRNVDESETVITTITIDIPDMTSETTPVSTNPTSSINHENDYIYDLIQGDWICESDASYLRFFYDENNRIDMELGVNSNFHPYCFYYDEILAIDSFISAGILNDVPDGFVQDNETLLCVSAMYGEFNCDALLVVDNNSEYIKFQLCDDYQEWYTYYPYDGDMNIEDYIFSAF